jgi:hypothetical protein
MRRIPEDAYSHSVEEDRNGYEGKAVGERRGQLVLLRAEGVRDDRCRERYEGHAHQQQQVQNQQRVVDADDVLEDVVVVDPHDADAEEADHVAEVRRPETDQRFTEVLARLDVGHADLDDQQRDRDREDAVAERLQALRVLVVRPGVVVT